MENKQTIRELLETYQARKLQAKINWLIDREVKGHANIDEIQALNQLAHLILDQLSLAVDKENQSARISK